MNYFIIFNFIIGFMLSGMFVFLFNYKNLLINLLSIEYMMLFLLMCLVMMYSKFNLEYFFIMMFMMFMVTEGVLGLSLLVCMIRIFGNSNLSNLYLNNY